MKDTLNKQDIINLLPHREPMLLIDELINIKKLFSATAILNVKKDSFFVQGHFPGQPVMPGVLIVEAFGQAAAALTAAGIDKKEYENKLVFLMSVEKARFRNPVIPNCKLELNIEAIRSHGRVWKYKGEAYVQGKKMADAQWAAAIALESVARDVVSNIVGVLRDAAITLWRQRPVLVSISIASPSIIWVEPPRITPPALSERGKMNMAKLLDVHAIHLGIDELLL